MARGILSRRGGERLKSTVWGGAWGLVVGGAIVAVASQLAVRHDLALPQPEARAVETPAGTEFDQARPETDPALPSEDAAPSADVAAATPVAPEPADTSPSLDTTPAAPPAPSFAGPEAPDRPQVPGGADVALTQREGLRPETAGAPEARAPLPPRADQPAAVARDLPAPPPPAPADEVAAAPTNEVTEPEEPPLTETAELTAPELAAPGQDDTPALSVAPDSAARPPPAPPTVIAEASDAPTPEPDASSPEAPAPVVADLGAEAPGAPAAEAPPPVAPETRAERAPTAPVPAAPEGEVPGNAPELAREIAESPAEPVTPEDAEVSLAEAETAPAPAPDAPVFARATAPEEEPAIPATPRPSQAEPPAVIELPRPIETPRDDIGVTGAPDAEAAMPGTPSVSVGQRVGTLTARRSGAIQPADSARGDATMGALEANRRSFAAEPGLARLAVVLVHEGAAPPDAEALAGLPGEVSFAVRGTSPNAATIAAAYRAAGREVVLIPSIPAGARPRDVEVALEANLGVVDEAVAVMDTGEAGFQNNRAAVGQVVAVLSDTGHGLITAPRGLNTAQQIAGRFDVPASLIFDDLGAGVDAGAVSRALDRAAFRARLEEGVILLGRADPATIEGLGAWLSGRNARDLALAPVSAVLAPETGAPTEAEARDGGSGGLPTVRSLPDRGSN